MPNRDGVEISNRWPGFARDQVSCPGCGKEYGAYGRKVCNNCQECEKCCRCEPEKKEFVEASVFVSDITS